MDSMAALTFLAVAKNPTGEGPQCVRVRVDGQDINCPTFLVENVHIEPLARQVQTGVQHGWSLLGAGCVDNPTLSPVGLPFMTFDSQGVVVACSG
jgi:hypothetical protein